MSAHKLVRRPVGASPVAAPFLGMLVLGMLGCASRSQARVEPEEDLGLMPVHEAWSADFVIADDGVRRLRIESGYMARFVGEDSTYLEIRPSKELDVKTPPVVVHMFDEDDSVSATLTAHEVVYNEDEQRFEARGKVVVTTDEGKTLETETLMWEEESRQIRSPGFVRIVTPKEELQGYRLRADESLETYEILRPTGTVVFEDDE